MFKQYLLFLTLLIIFFSGKAAPPLSSPADSKPQLCLPTTDRQPAAGGGGERAIPSVAGEEKKETETATRKPAPKINNVKKIGRSARGPINCNLPVNKSSSAGEQKPALPGPEESVNFLLMGHRCRQAEYLIMVSLVPGENARLLAFYPKTLEADDRDWLDRAAANPRDRTARHEVNNRLGKITGKDIQFTIGLDLEGVIKMIDLMGGVTFNPGKGPVGKDAIAGWQAVELLTREELPVEKKEDLLRIILLRAGALELTKVGWNLLKIGYHSLTTDLSIADLLQLRKVTHSITPYEMSYRELAD